jgi:hypothetical protein
MKLLGLVIGLVIICVGVVGLVSPGSFLAGAEYTLTVKGLYIIAAFRIVVGVVLLIAASASRLPKTMRVFGVIAVLAGLTTPLMGVARARAILDWWTVYGTNVIRFWGVIAVAVGAIITFAFASHRRAV